MAGSNVLLLQCVHVLSDETRLTCQLTSALVVLPEFAKQQGNELRRVS